MTVITPLFAIGPRNRLWLALQRNTGHWVKIADVMFDAGFGPYRGDRDRLTPFTAFHFHLEQIKSGLRGSKYRVAEANGHVMLVDRI